ncbi:MAG: DUF47 family protein [Candidatus Eremiobacteraeota bacterium]|nr:DUF47 family protein [Candidatus Eremiobacteraeota bacterium]
MWLADLVLPGREDRFHSLLCRHAGILTQVARDFRRYLQDETPATSDEIDALEQQADELLHECTRALRDTFVTPMDRQDIYSLAEAIDDMIDYIDNATHEISLFNVSPTAHMRAMAEMLENAAVAIEAGVRSLKSNPQAAWAQAREAQQAENLVEDRYRTALAELFNSKDVNLIFKLREVYRHLSNSADRADAIGRLIGKIVVKAP